MRGEASLISDRRSRDSFAPELRKAGLDARVIAEELFSFTRTLDGSRRLERALTDVSRSAGDKQALVDALLADAAQPLTVEILHDLVGRQWSREDHIANAVEDFAVDAMMYYADARGVTLRVTVELAEVHSVFLNLPMVRTRLSDATVESEARLRFLDQLLAGQRLDEITVELARHATGDLRNRRFIVTVQWLINKFSRHMGDAVVTVTSAVPLTDTQTERIVKTYSAKAGRPVHINSVVDPKVLGGLRIQYGAKVTDNTVVAQLQQLRRKVGV